MSLTSSVQTDHILSAIDRVSMMFFSFSFGSLSMSSSSGIIFNNEMDDFSVPGRNNSFDYPPSPSNYIKPYHRPLSSSSPTIVTDEDGAVVMVAGASGGSKIPTATSQVYIAGHVHVHHNN